MKSFILLLYSIVVCILLVGCDEDKRTTARTVSLQEGSILKLGLIAPLSGPDKAWGENGLSGIKTAIQLEPVLINGGTIELIPKDDKHQPELTREAFIKLVTEEKVVAVLLMSNSECALNLVEIADEYKTPILALASTHPDITKSNDYISQLLFDDHFQASVAALYVMDELFVDRVGVLINEQNPHSQYLATEFITKFTSIGGTVVEIDMMTDETFLSEKLQFVQKNQDIDFLYTPLDADLMLSLARTLSTLDWHPQMMASDSLQATIVLQYPDDLGLVDGMLATDPYGHFEPVTEYGRKISKLYRDQAFETPGTVLAALGAEGTSLLLSAMNRCYGKDDRMCLNREIRSTRDFSGIFGKIDIRHSGKAERAIFINVIDGAHLRGKVKVH